MAKQRIPHSPTAVQRDHARPWAAPAPSAAAVQARLAELVVPAPDARADEYRRPGHRWRILTLPVLVALVLAMSWRQVPSGSSLAAMLAHEGLLWAPRRVSQPALSLRLRMLSAELFAALLGAVLPFMHAQAAGRSRPLPRPAARARAAGYGRVWILDASTLEALFQRVGLLRRAPGTPLGGKLLAVLDAARTLPVRRWHGRDAPANGKSFLEVPPAGPAAGPRLLRLPAVRLADRPRRRLGAPAAGRGRGAGRRRPGGLADGARPRGAPRAAEEPLRAPAPPRGGAGRRDLARLSDQRARPGPAAGCGRGGAVRRARAGRGSRPDRQAAAGAQRSLDRVRHRHPPAGLGDLAAGRRPGRPVRRGAEALGLPLGCISLEMSFRGLDCFAAAAARGEADDPVRYLAAQPDLGIVQRRRKYRERQTRDKHPHDLHL